MLMHILQLWHYPEATLFTEIPHSGIPSWVRWLHASPCCGSLRSCHNRLGCHAASASACPAGCQCFESAATAMASFAQVPWCYFIYTSAVAQLTRYLNKTS